MSKNSHLYSNRFVDSDFTSISVDRRCGIKELAQRFLLPNANPPVSKAQPSYFGKNAPKRWLEICNADDYPHNRRRELYMHGVSEK